MPGPFDDPTQFAQIQGANGPFSVPTSIASRFQPPLTVPAIDPTQAAPLTVGGVPIPADIASRFAPTPAPVAPPAAPQSTGPNREQQMARMVAEKRDARAAASVPSPLDAAQSTTEAGLAERKQAAIDLGGSQAASAEAQADAIAEGNRQADLARAAAAKQAEQDKAEQQRMSADLSAAQKAYADHKVDQNRFWHDSSTGSKVLMGIGLALSAAGSVLKHEGAKNPALDMIMGAVKQDVALQLADRDKLGNVVGQKGSALDRMMAITRDNQATAQAAIAASLDRVKGQVAEIAARAQSPAAKANALDLHGQLTIEEGKAKAAAEETMYQRKKDDQQLAIQRQNTAIAGGHLALAQAEQKEKIRQFDLGRADTWLKESMDALQKGDANAIALAAKGQVTPEVAAKIQEMGIKERDQMTYVPASPSDKDPATGKPAVGFKPLAKPDGFPLLMPNADAKEFRDDVFVATKLSVFADKLVAMRDKYGFESDARKSDEWREMQQLWSEIATAKKNGMGLGALSGSDYELMNKAIGSGDPTEVRDPSAGLLQMRKSAWDSVDARARIHGYQGDRIEMYTPGTAEAAKSPVQQLEFDAKEQGEGPKPNIVRDYYTPPEAGDGMSAKAMKATTSLALMAAGKIKADPDAQAEALRVLEEKANSTNKGEAIFARRQIDMHKLPVKDPWWQPEKLLGKGGKLDRGTFDWSAYGLNPGGR